MVVGVNNHPSRQNLTTNNFELSKTFTYLRAELTDENKVRIGISARLLISGDSNILLYYLLG